MSQLALKIVTPEKEIFQDTVDQVNVSTTEGELGILPNHASLMAKLIPGELRIKKGEKITPLAIGEGFLQIQNNTLNIMTDLAIEVKDIDEKVVEQAKKRAQEALENKLSSEEYATTLANLEKALAQLRIKRKHRTHN